MLDNDNEMMAHSSSQLKRKRTNADSREELHCDGGDFIEVMGMLKDDLANHFLKATNMFDELSAAKQKINTLEDTVKDQTTTIDALTFACQKYKHDFREVLDSLKLVEKLVEESLTDLNAKEEKNHTLENTIEALKAECNQYKFIFSSSLAELGFAVPNAVQHVSPVHNLEETKKNLKPLLNCVKRNNSMKLELKTLKEKLESCEVQNRFNQKKLSEENQELKTKLDEMEECNEYLMLKEQTSSHKLDEANNELINLKKKLHEIEENLNALNKQLEVKTDDMEAMESLNQVCVVKERECNTELQEARKELIYGLQDFLNGRTMIGIKRMGELKQKPFLDVCKQKFSIAEQDWKSAEQCSFWQDRIKDPQWFPFCIIETNGKCEEIINENDDELKRLKNEWGNQVYEAICAALEEINEYNPSARYPVLELWNFKEDRKAQLKEVIQYLLKLAKKKTRKR